MGRTGDDYGRARPAGEPEPAELWIDHGSGAAPASPPGGRRRAPGRPGHARWIALAAGFAVLVAVIAVQHYAGGTNTTATDPVTSASIDAPATSLASAASTPSPGSASAGECGDGTCPESNTPATESGTPVRSMIASLSENGLVVDAESARTETAAPRTSRVSTGILPITHDWTLLGYGPAGLVRYRPATGQVVVTPVPPVQSGNPMISFLATPSGAIIRPIDDVEGYLVLDGKPATPLEGLLAEATRALPGPDPEHVWLSTSTGAENADDERTTLVLVDAHGKPSGQVMQVPPGLGQGGGYAVAPDGAGYALVLGVGGTYDLTPAGVHLVTHGDVLAAGPTGYLVSDCTDTGHCSVSVVDRASGKRRTVPGLAPSRGLLGMQGTISPDGRYAARWTYGPSGTMAQLIDLTTGHVSDAGVTGGDDPLSSLAFTPDSRYLLVAGMTAVTPVDVRTGKTIDPLPIPPVRMLALRPGG